MKKKFNYICLASLLALGTACQDDNLVTKENGGNMLTFSVSYASDPQSKAQTRSLVEFTDEDGKPTPFDISLSVEDTYAETPITRGTPISTLKNFTDNVKEFRAWGYYDGTAWTDVTGSKIKQYAGADYRPVNGSDQEVNAYKAGNTNLSKYRFYAIYPFDNDELSDRGATVSNNTSNGFKITYNSPDDGDNDAVAQKEVLAGYMQSTTSMSVVPITFQPILAAIQFKVSPNLIDRRVKIKKIRLQNFYNKGVCNVTSAGVSWDDPVETDTTTFVQTFDDLVSDAKKGDYFADPSKTFFVIPRTGSSLTQKGTMIIIDYKEVDGDGNEIGTKTSVARHLLYGNKFEAGKTYIYNIGCFDNSDGSKEPWVDFSNFVVNDESLLGKSNEIHEMNNSKFEFDFEQVNGTYEKASFKIYNLKEGDWYSIAFTERIAVINKTTGDELDPVSNTPYYNAAGAYACVVRETLPDARATGTDSPTQEAYRSASNLLVYYPTNVYPESTDDKPPFIWQHPTNIYNQTTYKPFYDPENPGSATVAKLTFKATASEMWWRWDYSRGKDNQTLRARIFLIDQIDDQTGKKVKIKKITPEADVPTVDFLNATIYNTAHNSGNNVGVSSHKTYAVDATHNTATDKKVTGELYFRVKNSEYGRLNIPLLNLNTSKTYQITYTLNKEGTTNTRGTGTTAATKKYGLGYVIQDSPNTSADTFNPTTNGDYTSFRGTYSNQVKFKIENKSFEFTPTASTMYWVWDFSEFSTGNNDHQFITFSDVTIEEIDD